MLTTLWYTQLQRDIQCEILEKAIFVFGPVPP